MRFVIPITIQYMKKFTLAICFIGACVSLAFCQTGNEKVFTVAANQIKAHVQPTMYGIFFEDINMAGDGGVYARTGEKPIV